MDVSIDDLIGSGHVTLDLQATNAEGVVKELAALLDQQGRLNDRDGYVQAVLDREQETGGTGMESGVAIPHARSAAVAQPSLAFGRSSNGISFGADDGTPADIVFLIAAPEGENQLHVQVLSKLARKLIHDDFRSALREAGSADEVVEILEREVTL